jgi:hypothetical protein
MFIIPDNEGCALRTCFPDRKDTVVLSPDESGYEVVSLLKPVIPEKKV